jgi:hypothetical protein
VASLNQETTRPQLRDAGATPKGNRKAVIRGEPHGSTAGNVLQYASAVA